MCDVDLDINNYSINDLEKFFHLNPKKKYSPNDVELKEYEIREQLLSSGHVKPQFKRDLIEFLGKAKQWLIYSKFGTNGVEPKDQTLVKQARYDDELVLPETPYLPNTRADNELINRPEKPFVYANNSEYFQGNMNPLNTRVVTKYVAIDSRFRDNYSCTSASDYVIQLPSRLNKVVSMQLSAIEFPITYYPISASYGNNFLYMYAETQYIANGPITPYEKVVIIPDGSYTATDLIAKINGILAPKNNAGVLSDPNCVFSYIKLTLDINDNSSGTARITIAPDGLLSNMVNSIGLDFTKSIKFCVDDRDITTKIGWNLGFTKAKYFGSNSYTGEAVIDLSIMRYIYLGIDDYQRSSNNLFFNAFHHKPINENVLARISMHSDSFSVLMADNMNMVTEPRKYFGPVDIQKLRIQLFDDHGRHLDINNSNYSFVLLFKMLYDL